MAQPAEGSQTTKLFMNIWIITEVYTLFFLVPDKTQPHDPITNDIN